MESLTPEQKAFFTFICCRRDVSLCSYKISVLLVYLQEDLVTSQSLAANHGPVHDWLMWKHWEWTFKWSIGDILCPVVIKVLKFTKFAYLMFRFMCVLALLLVLLCFASCSTMFPLLPHLQCCCTVSYLRDIPAISHISFSSQVTRSTTQPVTTVMSDDIIRVISAWAQHFRVIKLFLWENNTWE